MQIPKSPRVLFAVSFCFLAALPAARAADQPALCDEKGGVGAPILKLPDPTSSDYGAKRDALVNNWYRSIYKVSSPLHEQMVPVLDRGDVSMKDANYARQQYFNTSYGKRGLILQICEAKRAGAKRIQGFQTASQALDVREKGGGLDADACKGSFSTMVSELSAAVKAYQDMDKKIDNALQSGPNAAGAFDRGRRRDYTPITVLKSYFAEKFTGCQRALANGTPPTGVHTLQDCGQNGSADSQAIQRLVKEYEALWGHFEYPNTTNRKPGGKYSDFLLQLQQEEKRAQTTTLPGLYKLSDKMKKDNFTCSSIVGETLALPGVPAFRSLSPSGISGTQ